MKDIKIIIISGLSGSGKTTALRTLEDLGFFCVDNLPILLLPKFVELSLSSTFDISRVALVMDVREGSFLKEYHPTISALVNDGYSIECIYLDCANDELIQRFSETRRQHPLSKGGSVAEGIEHERAMLQEIKARADRIIDTTGHTVHDLRKLFQEYFVDVSKHDMKITCMSFGFKYGVPHDVDLIFDVRFLPNPYFVRDLKNLNGTDEKVREYVMSSQMALDYIKLLKEFLSFQIPLFEKEGKTYLTAAFGCTGGRHRSVTIAECIHEFFAEHRKGVHITHRDIYK